ncbi:MAG: hypothetical protein SGI83_08515 [Bacteroidota bacterium]|mgnify:CR=1 FL=1|nr:hypothetical protein [Bacteroidota bacterium]
MRKYILFCISLLFVFDISAQDYVVSWNNDTSACKMPEKPWKDGLRPSGLYDNGHVRTVAFFPTDSVRIIEPGKVKGYFRHKHGKRYLCDGYFESRKINEQSLLNLHRNNNESNNPWGFMQAIVKGKYATLYLLYAKTFRFERPVYLIARHDFTDPLYTEVMWTRKEAYTLLADASVKESMEQYRKSMKKQRIRGIVEHYNKLMDEHYNKNNPTN